MLRYQVSFTFGEWQKMSRKAILAQYPIKAIDLDDIAARAEADGCGVLVQPMFRAAIGVPHVRCTRGGSK